MGMVYDWKPGSRLNQIDADVAGAEIERIKNRDGVCRPETLVEENSHVDAPLYGYFYAEDDTEAARRWRLDKAGHLLRCVVRIEPSEHGDQIIRAFVPVVRIEPDKPVMRGYVPLEEAMSREDERAQVLAQVDAELKAIRRKYGHFKERAEVWQAIDQIEGKDAELSAAD